MSVSILRCPILDDNPLAIYYFALRCLEHRPYQASDLEFRHFVTSRSRITGLKADYIASLQVFGFKLNFSHRLQSLAHSFGSKGVLRKPW